MDQKVGVIMLTYNDLLHELELYGSDEDADYYLDDAMSFAKKVTGKRQKYSDPVPQFVYVHLKNKFGIVI